MGSSTPPVLEVLEDGVNGMAVDFFDTRALAERIERALVERRAMGKLREAARATAMARFDLQSVLLPRWLALF